MRRDDLFAGYEQGQWDMLAKCIQAVDELIVDDCREFQSSDCDTCAAYDTVVNIMRALINKP